MCTRVESSTLHFLERRYNEDSRSVLMPLERHLLRTQNANQHNACIAKLVRQWFI